MSDCDPPFDVPPAEPVVEVDGSIIYQVDEDVTIVQPPSEVVESQYVLTNVGDPFTIEDGASETGADLMQADIMSVAYAPADGGQVLVSDGSSLFDAVEAQGASDMTMSMPPGLSATYVDGETLLEDTGGYTSTSYNDFPVDDSGTSSHDNP